jgi:LmbE family N-acetylglucosaminyl deacetylase
MPGLLAFHAHPDDEVISTGGTLSHYAEAGEQVVVVTATDGAEGEIHNYEEPESYKSVLAEMRAEEISNALALLGIPHHEFLGYRDSGMMGTEANDHLDSFWRADFFEATGRLVHLIRRYRPDVMTIYDPFGGYGHPDHIQVHRIGLAAFFGSSDLARFPLKDGDQAWEPAKLYWTAWPRSRMRGFAEARKAAGLISDEEYAELKDAGTPDEDITCWMDVSHLFDRKEAALRAHRTQIPDDWFLLTIPDEFKSEFFGREAFVRIFSRVDAPRRETDLFTGLR